MNRRIWLLAFLFCIGLNPVFSQRQMEVIYDEQFLTQEFIDDNFTGGYADYVDFFEEQLSFPEKSYKNQVEGLMLFYFEVFPNKNSIEVNFLTRLDEHIEENIRAAVEASKNRWTMQGEGPYRIYQPIIYSLLPYYPHTLLGDLPELPADLPLKFQQMFILIKSKRIDPDFDIKAKADTAAVSKATKQAYIKALGRYERMMDQGESSHAYDALTAVIRYNPLNKELLLSRIALEKELGINRFQAYDAYLLSDFVDKIEENDSGGEKRKFSRPLDSLYAEGQNEYELFIQSNFIFPPKSNVDGIQGVLLVAIEVDKTSGVNFRFLTHLDDDIEKIARAVLDYKKDQWDIKEEPYTLYQPFFFSLDYLYPDQLEDKVNHFVREFKFPVLNPFFINAYSFPPKTGDNIHLKAYRKAQSKLETNLKKGKTKKVLEELNHMIRYNPFDQALIEQRMALEKELGKSDFGVYDQALLEALKYFK